MHSRRPAKVPGRHLWRPIIASFGVLLRKMRPRLLLPSWLDLGFNATCVCGECVGCGRICCAQAAGAQVPSWALWRRSGAQVGILLGLLRSGLLLP